MENIRFLDSYGFFTYNSYQFVYKWHEGVNDMAYEPEFEKEWQEYMDGIADLDLTPCPMCKKHSETLFECGRRVEHYARIDDDT